MSDDEIDFDFDEEFYTGVGTTNDVPGAWDIALNGRHYMLDTNHPAFGGQSAYLGRMGIETIPLIRQQADSSDEPGESTINPEDLWPRSQHSWHKGAGQEYLDNTDSDRARFRRSKGVNVWERGKLSLLNDTEKVLDGLVSTPHLIHVGSYAILWESTTTRVRSTLDYSTWTDEDITDGEVVTAVHDIATDGRNVWVITDDGVHTADGWAYPMVWTHYADNPVGHYYIHIWFAKGRLIAASDDGGLYNITTSGAAPTAMMNAGRFWNSVTGGTHSIYAATNNVIYRTAVKADGTSLDVPVIAGELPEGEAIECIYGYLGFLLIGTYEGFRVATQDADGNLTMGALVKTGNTVYTFLGHGQYVYFSMDSIGDDENSSGLGRMDLTQFNDSAPAYTSDLRGGADTTMTIIDDPGRNKLVFGVWGDGIYMQTNTFVASGYIDSGYISYGIPDPKVALRLSVKHKELDTGDSVAMWVSIDEATPTLVGTSNTVGSSSPDTAFRVPELAAQLFEVRAVLTGAATLERYDLRAYPVSHRGKVIFAPILLYENIVDGTGAEHAMDVLAERAVLEALPGSERLASYQELATGYSVFVEDADFQRHHATRNRSTWNGTMLVKLKVLGD